MHLVFTRVFRVELDLATQPEVGLTSGCVAKSRMIKIMKTIIFSF